MAVLKCAACGCEIDPARFEDCEKAYLTADGLLCKDHFLDFLENNFTLDEIAAALGVGVLVMG